MLKDAKIPSVPETVRKTEPKTQKTDRAERRKSVKKSKPRRSIEAWLQRQNSILRRILRAVSRGAEAIRDKDRDAVAKCYPHPHHLWDTYARASRVR